MGKRSCSDVTSGHGFLWTAEIQADSHQHTGHALRSSLALLVFHGKLAASSNFDLC